MLLLLDFWIGFLEKWIKLKHTHTTHTCGLTNTLDFLETPVPKRSQAIPSVRIETMGKNAFLKQSHPGFSWKKAEWLILPSDFKSLLKGWTWNRTWLAAAFDISFFISSFICTSITGVQSSVCFVQLCYPLLCPPGKIPWFYFILFQCIIYLDKSRFSKK